jgi:peptide/nickel transport system permease protein
MPEPSAEELAADLTESFVSGGALPGESDGATVIPGGITTLVLDAEPIPDVEVEQSATKRLGIGAWLAMGWLTAVVAGAILAPWLPIGDPQKSIASIARQGSSPGHLLGGDGIGRDVLARLVWGGRASLLVSGSAVLMGLVAGGSLGLIAGYFRGRLDTVLTNMFNVLLAIPPLVLALALVAVFASDPRGSSSQREFWLVMSLGIVSIPILGRITRANTLAWAQREFVLAARAMGAKNRRILIRDVLPNVLPAMFSIALLGVAVTIVAEGGLSVLGVGVKLPTPSWGNMIAEGRTDLNDAPHIVFAPAGVIFLTVLSLNYLGDVVRARFDVRESAL